MHFSSTLRSVRPLQPVVRRFLGIHKTLAHAPYQTLQVLHASHSIIGAFLHMCRSQVLRPRARRASSTSDNNPLTEGFLGR
jgi:hypothetical protein